MIMVKHARSHGREGTTVRRRPFQRLSSTGWLDLSLFALAILEALYLFGLAHTTGVFTIMGADFRAFYAAARIAWEEGFDRIYDLAAHQKAQRDLCAIAAGRASETSCVLVPMVFPAVFVLAGLPLTHISPTAAFAAWMLLNVLGPIAILRPWLQPLDAPERRRRLAMATLSFPVFVNLLWGQFNLWLLLCVSACLMNWHRGKPLRAGLWLSGLILKPQTLPLLLPALALTRRWVIMGGWAAGTATLLALSFLLTGPSGMRDWLRLLLGFARPIPGITPAVVGAETMMNWRSIGVLLDGFMPSLWAWGVVGCGMLLTAGAALVGIRTIDLRTAIGRERFLLAVLAATLAVSWHAHNHTAMILLPMLLSLEARRSLPWRALVLWTLWPAWVPFVDILLVAWRLAPPIAGLDNFIVGKILFGFHLYFVRLATGGFGREAPGPIPEP